MSIGISSTSEEAEEAAAAAEEEEVAAEGAAGGGVHREEAAVSVRREREVALGVGVVVAVRKGEDARGRRKLEEVGDEAAVQEEEEEEDAVRCGKGTPQRRVRIRRDAPGAAAAEAARAHSACAMDSAAICADYSPGPQHYSSRRHCAHIRWGDSYSDDEADPPRRFVIAHYCPQIDRRS